MSKLNLKQTTTKLKNNNNKKNENKEKLKSVKIQNKSDRNNRKDPAVITTFSCQ